MKPFFKNLLEVVHSLFDRRWWAFIETSKSAHPENVIEQVRHLENALTQLPAGQIKQFHWFYRRQRYAAFQPNLWLVSKIISSDFADFEFVTLTSFLVLSGRQTFQRILKFPEEISRMPLPKGVPLELIRDLSNRPT